MIISRTPLRLSLLGGGSDFPAHYTKHGGAALSLTIDKFIYAIVKRRTDARLRITYTQAELVDHLDFVRHDLIREALKRTGIEDGIEIVTIGDLPSGNGLASSSAVTVGVLHALYALQNELPTAQHLADDAIQIELFALKKPQGVQDQLAVAHGGLRLYDFRAETNMPIPVSNLADHLLLFHTGNTRQAETILQTIPITQKTAVLGELAELARIGAGYLLAGNVRAIGGLLAEAWELKKRMSPAISNGRINEMVKIAYDRGASGVKVAGAGGGGYLAVFCDDDDVKASVRRHLPDELPFDYHPYGSRIIYHE